MIAYIVLAAAISLLSMSAVAQPTVGREAVDECEIRLVLLIIVDQLRGDMLLRFHDRFGEDGFAQLMNHGVHYTNAHYAHAATATAPGHATIATGGNPPEHGIVGNEWFDRSEGKLIYAAADPRFRVLDQPASDGVGTSPLNLLSTTIGDELVLAHARRSRAFGVSQKDRSAIFPAGHLGSAWWYSERIGGFTTSTYYARELPEWALQWNGAHTASRYAGYEWALLHEQSTYVFRDQDERETEANAGELGTMFPHRITADHAAAQRMVQCTPFADEHLLEFTKELIAQEHIGRGEAPDLLAISFAATDAIGHTFGPNSLEAEDNLLRLDRTIANLLQHVDELVGLEHTLIVLSADHGIDVAPGFRHTQKAIDRAGDGADATIAVDSDPNERGAADGDRSLPLRMRLEQRKFPDGILADLDAAFRKEFGIEQHLIVKYAMANIWLDLEVIRTSHVSVAEVEQRLAEELREVPGIAHAFTRSDLMRGAVPDHPQVRLIERSFHPQRSGNVLLALEPFWYLHHQPTNTISKHGSPFAYDTHVPMIFAGPGIAPQRIVRRVHPHDIAPTIAQYLGISAPTGSIGDPLPEVLDSAAVH